MEALWGKCKPGYSGWISIPAPCGAALDVELELFVCRGAAPGPVALIVAGIHGDEYEGPASIWQLVSQLDARQVSGTVLLLPVASPLAYHAGTRFTPPDGVNLARVFPGDPQGSPTERLAAFLFEEFGRRCDYLIDLHSGGVEYDFVPVAGFRGDANAANPSFQAARALGLAYLWQLPDRPGVFSREAARLGTVTIGAEYRGCGQLSREGVEAYARGILSCLALWRLLDRPHHPEPEPPVVYSSRWLLCPATGTFTTTFALGDPFEPGETLAVIRNTRGEPIGQVVADEPGTVLALRSKAYAREGDWAVLLGKRQ